MVLVTCVVMEMVSCMVKKLDLAFGEGHVVENGWDHEFIYSNFNKHEEIGLKIKLTSVLFNLFCVLILPLTAIAKGTVVNDLQRRRQSFHRFQSRYNHDDGHGHTHGDYVHHIHDDDDYDGSAWWYRFFD